MSTAPAQATARRRRPAASGSVAGAQLYIVRDDGIDVGIGTAGEIRDLIAEGILPATVSLVAVSR